MTHVIRSVSTNSITKANGGIRAANRLHATQANRAMMPTETSNPPLSSADVNNEEKKE